MKIGIITYWSSDDNYGQQLQCWALQQVLIKMGHSPFLIRYIPLNKVSLLRRICRKLSTIVEGRNSFLRNEKQLMKINNEKNKKRRFSMFRDNNIISSKQIYYSLEQLQNNPPKADVYICGSDQVWHNTFKTRDTLGWFLDFGDENVRRISYAASIGREFNKTDKIRFKKLLNRYYAISVREESAKLLCDSLDISSTVTMDPTLLLRESDYELLLEKKSQLCKKNIVFLYILNVTKTEDIFWNEIRNFVMVENKNIHPVFSSGYVQARELIPGSTGCLDTISEWLGTLKGSDYVITNSFHGMAFAIIFHRPFIVIPLRGEFSSGNARITTILNYLGLGDRIFEGKMDISKQIKNCINWDKVDKKLDCLRKESKLFIKKALC